MYELAVKKRALKAMLSQPAPIRNRMIEQIDRLAGNPDDAGLDIERIAGSPLLRLKFSSPAGQFRAIFERDDDARQIIVKVVEPRGQAYDVRRLRR